MNSTLKKAFAAFSLVAMLVVNLPQTFSVPEFVQSLTSIPTASAGVFDCQPSSLESFSVTVSSQTSYNFLWSHAGADTGDCDDIDYDIVAVNTSTGTPYVVQQYNSTGGSNTEESVNYNPATWLSIPDGTYRFRLVNTVSQVTLRSSNTTYTANNQCDASDISSFSIDGQVNGIVNTLTPTAAWTTPVSANCPNTRFLVEFYESDGGEVGDLISRKRTGAGASSAQITTNLQHGENYFVQLRRDVDNVLFDTYAFTVDTVNPAAQSAYTSDLGEDGFIDTITVILTDDFNDLVFSGLDYKANFEVAGRTVTDVTNNGTQVTITFNEKVAPNYDTAETPTVTYTNEGNITDEPGNQLQSFNITPSDNAQPVVINAAYTDFYNDGELDGSVDGFVESVRLTFSEVIDDTALVGNNIDALLTYDDAGYGAFTFNTTHTCNSEDADSRIADSNYICLVLNDQALTSNPDTNLTIAFEFYDNLEDFAGNKNVEFGNDGEDEELLLDEAAPVIYAAETRDLNASGFLDSMKLFVSEPVGSDSVIGLLAANDSSGLSFNFEIPESEDLVTWGNLSFSPTNSCDGNDGRDAVTDQYICIAFAENEYSLDSDESIYQHGDTNLTPSVSMTSLYLADGAGNLSFAKTTDESTTTDKAAPVITSAFTKDLGTQVVGAPFIDFGNYNGKVDAVLLHASEPIKDQSLTDSFPAFAQVGLLNNLFENRTLRGNIPFGTVYSHTCQEGVEGTGRIADSNYLCLFIDEVLDNEEPVYDTDFDSTVAAPAALYTDLVENPSVEQDNYSEGQENYVQLQDGAAPVIIYAQTKDINLAEGDRPGLIDAMYIQFSEEIDDETVDLGNFPFEEYQSPSFDVENSCDGDFEREANTDTICIALNEVSTPFSRTFTGNTASTPVVQVPFNRSITADLAGNGINAHKNLDNPEGLALDAAGPAITFAETTTSSNVNVYFSEGVLLDPANAGLFVLSGFDNDVTVSSLTDDDQDNLIGLSINPSLQNSNDTGLVGLEQNEGQNVLDLFDNYAYDENPVVVNDGIPTVTSSSGSRGGGGGGGGSSDSSKDESTETPSITTNSKNPFKDSLTHWAHTFIETLHEKGVVDGRDAENYAPDELLTRAEMVKIALELFGFTADTTLTENFSDVESADWFYKYVTVATRDGVVSGYEDGTFRPNAPITRAEALKILLLAAAAQMSEMPATPFTDIEPTAWYAEFVNFAFANQIVSGKSTTSFAPNDFVTRAEMAKMAVLTSALR